METMDHINLKPQLKDEIKHCLWAIVLVGVFVFGFLSFVEFGVIMNGCSNFVMFIGRLIVALLMEPVLLFLSILITLQLIGMIYGPIVMYRFVCERFSSILLVLLIIFMVIGLLGGGIILLIEVIRELIIYRREVKLYEKTFGKFEPVKLSKNKKLTISIALIVVFVLGAMTAHYVFIK